jgi:hypothetical protein
MASVGVLAGGQPVPESRTWSLVSAACLTIVVGGWLVWALVEIWRAGRAPNARRQNERIASPISLHEQTNGVDLPTEILPPVQLQPVERDRAAPPEDMTLDVEEPIAVG